MQPRSRYSRRLVLGAALWALDGTGACSTERTFNPKDGNGGASAAAGIGGAIAGTGGRAQNGGTSASDAGQTSPTAGANDGLSSGGRSTSSSAGGAPQAGSSAGPGGANAGEGGSGGEGGALPVTPEPFTRLELLAGVPTGASATDGVSSDARFARPRGLAWMGSGAGGLLVADGDALIRSIEVSTRTVTTSKTPAPCVTLGMVGQLSGNAYVACADDTVRQISPSGQSTILAGSSNVEGSDDGVGAAASFRFRSPDQPAGGPDYVGLALDTTSLYVTDRGNSTLRQIDLASGKVTTLAGSPGAVGASDGVGAAARFSYPTGLALDDLGNILIADWGNVTIREFAPTTGAVTTLAGSPGMVGSTDGSGSNARFQAPIALVQSAGRVFVSDGNTIRRMMLTQGQPVDTVAGSASVAGNADGAGLDARFNQPSALALDRTGGGFLFVLDSQNNSVRRYSVASDTVDTLAGGHPLPALVDGSATKALFNGPAGLATDSSGQLFVADCRNNAIRSIDTASGDVITLAGSTMRGGVDGVGSAALFSLLLVGAYPAAGLGSDAAGHVFVSDSWNHAIRQIDVGTRKVTTLAGHLVPSGVGLQGTQDDLLGDNARFRWPGGMAEDAGKLYIVDASNTIRVVDSRTTSVTTLAGDPTASGSEDGIGANAHFKFSCTTLTGVAADAGALYVSDCGNATIRRIDEQSGAVTTLAGSAGNTGSADGKGAAARFERPSGIAADHAGNLYIADGSTLRKLVIASGEVSTIVGTPGSVPGYQTGPLPARLASPTGVAILANGEIAISDAAQNAVFVVRH